MQSIFGKDTQEIGQGNRPMSPQLVVSGWCVYVHFVTRQFSGTPHFNTCHLFDTTQLHSQEIRLTGEKFEEKVLDRIWKMLAFILINLRCIVVSLAALMPSGTSGYQIEKGKPHIFLKKKLVLKNVLPPTAAKIVPDSLAHYLFYHTAPPQFKTKTAALKNLAQ